MFNYFLNILALIPIVFPLIANGFSTALNKGQVVSGFTSSHIYTGIDSEHIGIKLVHNTTGVPIIIIEMDTVPQMFTWVETPDLSNKGLPHSLEHLLAGKGIKGRYKNLERDMLLGMDKAATYNDYVFYEIGSSGSIKSFYQMFDSLLAALYKPDFTDLEAEREFYHFAVNTDKTGKKSLIEKGTVYNEMLSSENEWDYYRGLKRLVLGPRNPITFDSGGVPAEMRTVTPEEIRKFHEKNYKLGPTSHFIFILPPDIKLDSFLRQTGIFFQKYVMSGERKISALEQPYPIEPDTDTKPRYYPYPKENKNEAGVVRLAWKAIENHSLLDEELLDYFMTSFANGESSLLYKTFINAPETDLDLKVTSVSANLAKEHSPFFAYPTISLAGISSLKMNDRNLLKIRDQILAELNKVATWSDDEKNLAVFNEHTLNLVKANIKSMKIALQSPPLFGRNSNGYYWKEYFDILALDPNYKVSLNLSSTYEEIIKKLKDGKNIWREIILKFKMFDVPFIVASKASPELKIEIEAQRIQRIKLKIDELKKKYKESDEQKALTQFENEEKDKSKTIDELAKKVPQVHFMKNPPLAPDEKIQFEKIKIAGVPSIITFFEKSPTKEMNLYLNLDWLSEKQLKYVSILASFMRETGLRDPQQVTPFNEFEDQIINSLESFDVSVENDFISQRSELRIQSSANNLESLEKAFSFIKKIFNNNDLSSENKQRLRAILNEKINQLKLRTLGYDTLKTINHQLRYVEFSKQFFSEAFLTKLHFYQRLNWQLHDATSETDLIHLNAFASELISDFTGLSKIEIQKKLEALKFETANEIKISKKDEPSQANYLFENLKSEFVQYWLQLLPQIPDAETDYFLKRVLVEVNEDLKQGFEQTLDEIKGAQKALQQRQAMFLHLLISRKDIKNFKKPLEEFLKSFPEKNPYSVHFNAKVKSPLLANLQRRYPNYKIGWPIYAGLVNENATLADIYFTASSIGLEDLDEESLARFLESNIYAGGAPHSFFMKTWDRGLAYSNGSATYLSNKSILYFAENVPSISSLMELIDKIVAEKLTLDDYKNLNLLDYTLSKYFDLSVEMYSPAARAASLVWSERTGITKEKYKRFSKKLLDLRNQGKLISRMLNNSNSELAKVLISSDEKTKENAQSSFLFTGSEALLRQAQDSIPSKKSLLKIWPSDFWLIY